MQNDRLIQLTYSEDEDIVDRQDFTVMRPNVRKSPSRRGVRVCACARACVCVDVRAYVYSCVELCMYLCTCVHTYVCTRVLCLSVRLSLCQSPQSEPLCLLNFRGHLAGTGDRAAWYHVSSLLGAVCTDPPFLPLPSPPLSAPPHLLG